MAATMSGLPLITSTQDVASYARTVAPYLHTLPEFLQQLWSSATAITQQSGSTSSVVTLYRDTNPFLAGLAVALLLGPVFLLTSEAFRNYSQVDRAWSILPAIYVGHFNLWGRMHGVSSARMDMACAVATVWGARLTFNYWRKGGYEWKSEDYRWQIVKERIGLVGMFVLNASFIAMGQSVSLHLPRTNHLS